VEKRLPTAVTFVLPLHFNHTTGLKTSPQLLDAERSCFS
jgi:hypothetical protein